ncbi:MAG: inositol monophosphatase family protein [Pseudomonadota bacterium]
MDVERLQTVAMRALDQSDAIISRAFRAGSTSALNKVTKAGEVRAGEHFDPVTQADRDAELAIREVLGAELPNHGIIGEEFDTVPGRGPHSWIIDPIDGTRAFVAGLPTFGTLLGLLEDGDPIAGVMSQPVLGERFSAFETRAKLRDQHGCHRLATSAVTSIDAAVLATTDPFLFPQETGEAAAFDACRTRAKIVRFGGDCYSYCLLAAGHIDLVIETRLHAYDIAPLIPIVRGAGGVISNWQGGSAAAGGQVVAAATPALHAEACQLLASGLSSRSS